MFTRKTPFITNRGIHLDLKGLPPTPDRLLDLIDIFKKLRINIILVEYNGMYPWTKKKYRFKNHYSLKNIKDFLSKSKDSEIKIIPLIQGLGHMEMILGLPENHKYREQRDNPAELCPLKNGAKELVREMINDIISTHNDNIEYFHLGGDEAWNFGSCPKCRNFISKSSKSDLYRMHYTPLLDTVTNAGIRPMLWADMMREWSIGNLKKIGEKADLIEWSYSPDPFTRYNKNTLPENYRTAGVNLWGASAFKGADGSIANRPDLISRIENNLKWASAAKKYPLKGIIATGWSRYSDYTAQCESFEASLDSLVLCSAIMWNGKASSNPAQKAIEYIKNNIDNPERTEEIISISNELNKWFKTLHPHIDNLCRHSNYNSEPERINKWEYNRDKINFENFAKKIEQEILPKWKNLHKNLIPNYWTDIYIKSRISYLRKIYSSLCKNS